MQLAQARNPDPNQAQPASPLTRKIASGFRWVFLAFAGIGIPVFIAVLAGSFWLFTKAQASVNAADAAPVQTTAVATPSLSAEDLHKAIEAAVDGSLKRDELLLDKLLMLVGLYSTILSVLALSTVVLSRQDAKDQLATVNAKAEALENTLRQELAGIQSKAQGDVDALKTQVRSEFPIISQLQGRILNLILKLEAKYPEDENWNRPQPASWTMQERQQDVLIDESQILAVSVVVLNDANLLKLYLVLARSYFERFRSDSLTDGDAARAHLYASRAIDCCRECAEAYRMRGVSALSRFTTAPARQKSNEFRDLLLSAKTDFLYCKQLEPLNAGAFYNLALIAGIEGNNPEAIRLSEELLAESKNVTRKDKEKYFADIYINLACFLADQSKAEKDATVQNSLYERILRTCTEGKQYLETDVKSSRALENFRVSLARELSPNGDFEVLPENTKSALRALL